MITAAVKGKDVDLYEYTGGVATFIACAISCAINKTSEVVAITTVNSGIENEYEGGAIDASVDFSGVITLDVLGAWQFEDFFDNVGTKRPFIMKFTNDYGDVLSYSFSAVIQSTSGRGDATDFGLFDVSMVVSGAMTKLKTYDGALLDSNGDPILDSNGVIIRS